ncbi:MAG: hypothetical protein J0L93_02705 [Deltaproteobacteria bacterium]|nr:hypothetical protein [Deltaproteobacteria bacterium]
MADLSTKESQSARAGSLDNPWIVVSWDGQSASPQLVGFKFQIENQKTGALDVIKSKRGELLVVFTPSGPKSVAVLVGKITDSQAKVLDLKEDQNFSRKVKLLKWELDSQVFIASKASRLFEKSPGVFDTQKTIDEFTLNLSANHASACAAVAAVSAATPSP